jgi:hypothetical protein
MRSACISKRESLCSCISAQVCDECTEYKTNTNAGVATICLQLRLYPNNDAFLDVKTYAQTECVNEPLVVLRYSETRL